MELETQMNDFQGSLAEAVRNSKSQEMTLKKLQAVCEKNQKFTDVLKKQLDVLSESKNNLEAFASEKTAELVLDWDQKPLPVSRKDTKKKLEAEAHKFQEQLEKGRREQGLSGITLAAATERYNNSKNSLNELKKSIFILKENDRKLKYKFK